MIFTNELYNLLIRYTKDSENIDITMKQLYEIDWWRCVWGYWRAHAYYKMDNYYERLEDVPEGVEEFVIMTPTLLTQHKKFKDHKYTQTIDKAMCEKFYGTRI